MARKKICCIYRISSKVHPDRIYIGSTLDFHDRVRRHRGQLKNHDHHNIKLQSHVDKYGIDDFVFDIIEVINFESKEQVISKEQHYLDTLHPYLNINLIADSSIGVKRSAETRRRVGEAAKGRPMPQHVMELLIKINTGRHLSEEHKKAISIAQSKPKPWLSIRNMGNTYGRGRRGKKYAPTSESQKQKQRESMLGRPAVRKGEKRPPCP